MKKFLLPAILLLCPLHVFAHGTPILVEPAASSILHAVPAEVRLRFSERVEPAASTITVRAPDGLIVSDRAAIVDDADPYLFRTAIRSAGTGTYAVTWQILSADDGHFSDGDYVFSVGSASVTPASNSLQAEEPHDTGWPQITALWIELAGQAFLTGALAIFAVIWLAFKRRSVTPEMEEMFHRRFALLVTAGVLLILAGTVAYLWLAASTLAAYGNGTLPTALQTLLPTVAVSFTLYRLALALLFFVLFLSVRPSLRRADRLSSGFWILTMVVLAMALLRARVSHAAASPFLPQFSIVVNCIHLVFKDLWIGGLAALIFLILPVLELRRNARDLALSLVSFSKLLNVALAIGGMSGAYIVWLHLKSPDNLAVTHWGTSFVVLALVAFLLVVLRLYLQCVIDPAAVRLAQGKQLLGDDETVKSLLFPLSMEMCTGFVVLLLSAQLIITTPPLGHPALFHQTAASQGVSMELAQTLSDVHTLLLTVADASKNPPPIIAVAVTLTNADKGIGPILSKTEKRFEGGYVFPVSDLFSPGQWTVAVTAQRRSAYDATASFHISIPGDLPTIVAGSEARSFDGFAFFCILVSLSILIAAAVLFRRSRLLERACEGADPSLAAPSVRLKHFWVVLLTEIVLLLFVAPLHSHSSGGFAASCAKSGGVWEESPSIRFGQVTSPVPLLGCTIGTGDGEFHFIDAREFRYYLEKGS